MTRKKPQKDSPEAVQELLTKAAETKDPHAKALIMQRRARMIRRLRSDLTLIR